MTQGLALGGEHAYGEPGRDPNGGGCSLDSDASGGSSYAIEEVRGDLPRPPEVGDVGTPGPYYEPVGVETHLSLPSGL